MLVKWCRSEEGCVTSKCGRFEIEPRYVGRTTPQHYVLRVDGEIKKLGWLESQRDAKEAVEEFVRLNSGGLAG